MGEYGCVEEYVFFVLDLDRCIEYFLGVVLDYIVFGAIFIKVEDVWVEEDSVVELFVVVEVVG